MLLSILKGRSLCLALLAAFLLKGLEPRTLWMQTMGSDLLPFFDYGILHTLEAQASFISHVNAFCVGKFSGEKRFEDIKHLCFLKL